MTDDMFNIDTLKKIILTKQFVNFYNRDFPGKDQKELNQFLLGLKDAYKHNVYIEIDFQIFNDCKSEEREATLLLDRVNQKLIAKGRSAIQNQAISITHALFKISKSLESQALIVFHFFQDIYNEKEKNILRSIRKAIRNEISAYLGMLIISDRKVCKWELFPESPLDERHLSFYEFI